MEIAQRLEFCINLAETAAVVAWRHRANHAVLRHQFEQGIRPLVTRLRDNMRLQPLDTLPQPGEAEPYFGTFGGGYTFSFTPAPTRGMPDRPWQMDEATPAPALPGNGGPAERSWACILEVAQQAGYRFPAGLTPPLRLLSAGCLPGWPVPNPGEPAIGAGSCLPPGMVRRPELSPTGDRLRFWLEGPMLARLVDWGWDPGRPQSYVYRFRPLSVGTDARVIHRDSGEQIWLTEDVEW